MNAFANRESLPAVTAAGVVAIIFSALGVLLGLLVEVSMVVAPRLQTSEGAPGIPPGTLAAVEIFWLFGIAVSVFGLFAGIGVLRRRNWARITMLVWGGIMAVLSAVSIPVMLIVFHSLPSALPNGAEAEPFMGFLKVFMLFFYGIPLGIGIWWLVLFTRPRVSAAFTAPAEALAPHPPTTMDVTGFPLPAPTPAASMAPKPSCPLPLAIVAGFLIFGAVCIVFFAIAPLPSDIPFFVFGQAFGHGAGRIILLLFGLISGVTGVGIFKLKPWALYTQIVFQCIGLFNCLVTLFSPSYVPTMRAAMEKMYSQNPAFTGDSPFLSDTYFRSSMIFAAVLVGAVLVVLLWQRSRFLDQAAVAAAAKP